MGSIISGWPKHLRLRCLTEYRSAFPSGMPVLSQMPPFLKFDFRLFSEDKVMWNENPYITIVPTSQFAKGIILGGVYAKINGIVEALGALCTSSSVKVWIRAVFWVFGGLDRYFIRYPKSNNPIGVENVEFWANFLLQCWISVVWHSFWAKIMRYASKFEEISNF